MADCRTVHINIDQKLCKACGICVGMCLKKVFTCDWDGRPVLTQPDQCIACGMCELVCPDFAIRVVSVEIAG